MLHTTPAPKVPGGVLKLVLVRFVDHKHAADDWSNGRNIDAILMNGPDICILVHLHWKIIIIVSSNYING